MAGNPFAVAFVAVRVESRPGPLHRPTSARRQSSAIGDLGSDPLQEWLSYAPPFLSGKQPRSLMEKNNYAIGAAHADGVCGLLLRRQRRARGGKLEQKFVRVLNRKDEVEPEARPLGARR